MSIKQLTDSDISFITNALRVAAEQYGRDSLTMDLAFGVGSRAAQQFDAQADRARKLADELEQST